MLHLVVARKLFEKFRKGTRPLYKKISSS